VAGNFCFLGKNNLNIHSTLNKDIYFIFFEIGTDQQTTYSKFLINPHVWLVCAIFWNQHPSLAGKGLKP